MKKRIRDTNEPTQSRHIPTWMAAVLGLAFLLVPAAQGLQGAEPVIGDPQAGMTKATICAGCHGLDGNSFNPLWPKLAGQQPSQTLKQLMDFKESRRSDPMMTGVVAALTDQDMSDIAVWYASQKILSAGPDPEQAKRGEELYRYGRSEDGIIACGSCHNSGGQGYAGGIPGGIPAVGGQHAPYALKQLVSFKNGARNNDWNGVMANITAKLDEEELKALAEYMSGLTR